MRPSPKLVHIGYVIFDRDSTFSNEVVKFLKATGLEPQTNEPTSTLAEWNRGAMGGKLPARDHVIALNEAHLRRLMRDYVNYHHEDRIHDGLSKATACGM